MLTGRDAQRLGQRHGCVQLEPGLHSLANVEFAFFVVGTDLSGVEVYMDLSLGNACASFDPGCAFTRNVIAVPEPQTHALFGIGLLAVGWVARRRSGHSAV